MNFEPIRGDHETHQSQRHCSCDSSQCVWWFRLFGGENTRKVVFETGGHSVTRQADDDGEVDDYPGNHDHGSGNDHHTSFDHDHGSADHDHGSACRLLRSKSHPPRLQ